MAAEGAPAAAGRGANNAKIRDWCFTAYTWPAEGPQAAAKAHDRVTYIIFSQERCPDTGRLHLQGYVQFEAPTRLSQASAILRELGLGSPHLEKKRGTTAQAIAYCRKPESHVAGPWEFGIEPKGQGARSDIQAVMEKVRAGASDKEIAEEHPVTFARMYRGINAVRSAIGFASQPRDVKTLVIYGETGVGKSHSAFALFPGAYRPHISAAANVQWFDGLGDNKYLWLDEFRGASQRALSELLTWLDKWPLMVRTSSGFVPATWTRVVITSNFHPKDWYPQAEPVEKEALQRRLTVIWHKHTQQDQVPLAWTSLDQPAPPQPGPAGSGASQEDPLMVE